MSVATRADMDACGSIEAARSFLERCQTEAFKEAGLGVFAGIMLVDYDVEAGEIRYKAIPLADFYAGGE